MVALLPVPAMLLSQIPEDQWLIGDNGFCSSSKSKQLKFVSIQFSPAAGYFSIDNLAAGLRLNFSSYTINGRRMVLEFHQTRSHLFYDFFLLSEEKLNLFGDASFGYSWGKYKVLDFGGSHKYRHHSLAFMAGPALFINEHTALEVTVGHNYLSHGPIDSTITNKF